MSFVQVGNVGRSSLSFAQGSGVGGVRMGGSQLHGVSEGAEELLGGAPTLPDGTSIERVSKCTLHSTDSTTWEA